MPFAERAKEFSISKPIDTQVIVITGASSGIGLATARKAAGRGAKVMLVARNETALRKAVEAIEAAGGTADYAVADVAGALAVEAAAAKTIDRFGRIDTWVNNAGVALYAKLVDTPEDEHRRMFETNYFGTVNGARAAVSRMQRSGGTLITIGSIASEIPSPIMGAYAASKHAIKGFVDSLRIEVAADGLPINVTLIKPSGTSTPIAAHAANHLDGEALVAPPVYDPGIVADAILDAAERPIREMTVGGTGRLQTILSQMFPGLLARFGGLMIPLLFDPQVRKTEGNNLAAPAVDGDERSTVQEGRTISIYFSLGRRLPRVTALALGLSAVGLAIVLGSRRSQLRRSV